jgi:exopolysaccharide biosynthesis protein
MRFFLFYPPVFVHFDHNKMKICKEDRLGKYFMTKKKIIAIVVFLCFALILFACESSGVVDYTQAVETMDNATFATQNDECDGVGPSVIETEPTHDETEPPAAEEIQPTESDGTETPATGSHEHVYQEDVIDATCTDDGLITYTCKCGDAYTSVISAIGHKYKTKTVEPTVKTEGYDVHTCHTCGHSYKENYKAPVINYKEVNETVYAISTVNIRKGPSTDYPKLGSLNKGDSITRIGIGDNGWSKVLYNGQEAYIHSDYLTTEKTTIVADNDFPKTYSDDTCTITIYKEWYENAYVYAAHLEFTDYKRFGTSCANGKYNSGSETTSHAATRLGAIFAVNGCYSAPYLNYAVIRGGVVWNDNVAVAPGAYNSATGIFTSSGALGINQMLASEAVSQGLITDTFRFGDACLSNGRVINNGDTSRAQRTFIGTNGNAGDLWICVSDGRYNDGESAGLTYGQCGSYLLSKGCIFGIPLDGGGSSTMYFNGKVLNAARDNERAVVDFVYFR